MFPRKQLPELIKQAQDRKVSLLLGPRQVGKTTLLKELFTQLTKTKKSLFLDLDLLSHYEKVSTFESLLNTLKLNGYQEGQKEFFYLFLDEFQRYPNLIKIMKSVYDHLVNVKIYASGSSSLLIKDQAQESLAGRKKINTLLPLDFEEFLWFKQKEKLVKNFKNIPKLQGKALFSSLKEYYELLKEFLIFGGYPEVVLQKTSEEKKEILSSIFDLYIKKDLVNYLKIEKILELKKMIEFLAVNNGQKTQYEEITKLTSLSFQEIKRYLEIIKETYLISLLKPYYTNKNKELVKIPKIYFIDNGVRNFFINNFNNLSLRNDAGFLFEGFVLAELIKNGVEMLRFWQDKNGNEVDFILEQELTPIEVKFKQTLRADDFRELDLFLKEYPKSKKGYLVNLGLQSKSKKKELILPYSLATKICKS